MAEIVGLVASSLALAEIVGKVGSGILKLKRVYDEVENVPSTIQNLLKRLDVTFIMVEEATRQMSSNEPGLQDDTALRSCVLYCESALNEMAVSVDNLLVSIDATKLFKRKRGRIKVALNRDLLAAHERQLGDIVQFLTLAEAASSRHGPQLKVQIKRLSETLMQHAVNSKSLVIQQSPMDKDKTWNDDGKVHNITSVAKHKNHHIPGARGAPNMSSKPPRPRRSFFGSISSATHTSQINSSSSEFKITSREFRLELPWWLTARAWEVRTISGWQFSFRTYNIVPSQSPIFECILYGDVDGVLDLFRRGKATPFDINEYQDTVLDWSLEYGQVAVAKLLLQAGCQLSDLQPENNYYSRALSGYENILQKGTLAFEEYDALLIEHGFWELCEDVSFPILLERLDLARAKDKTAMETLLLRVSPKHYDLPIAYHLSLIDRFSYFSEPETFCLMLCKDGVLSASSIQEMHAQGFSMLHTTAYVSAGRELDFGISNYRRFWNSRAGIKASQKHGNLSRWKVFRVEVANRTIEFGSRHPLGDLPSKQPSTRGKSGSPFSATNMNSAMERLFGGLLSSILSSWERYSLLRRRMDAMLPKDQEYLLNTVLESWLDDLHRSGMDLHWFGQLELDIFNCIGRDESAQDDGFHPYHTGFGPIPSDWVFYWDWEVEDLAGEFWMMVENPILHIPGSWVDDDET